MKTILKLNYYLILLILFSCSSKKVVKDSNSVEKDDFVIAFGSCNKQYEENVLWKEIGKNNPDLWVWGGDNIYSDTNDMSVLRANYDKLSTQKGYADLIKNIPVMATWDDHDYGINDGGVEYDKKNESQEVFLDFFKVGKDSERRKRKGIYHSEIFKTTKGSIKVIVLDTRFFRTALTKSKVKKRRNTPNKYGEGTVLGEIQWKWLINELNNSKADFNIIVSSIQVLAAEHGFETWGNFPHEVDKLKNVITTSKAKGVLIISGDRHISEFSKTKVNNLSFPLIDFTSSGLTHSYNNFTSENNKLRVKNVVSEISFGLLKFNFDTHQIKMQMKGKENILLQEIIQLYQ